MSHIERREHLRHYVHAYLRCFYGHADTEVLVASLDIGAAGMQINVPARADAQTIVAARSVRLMLQPNVIVKGSIVGSERMPRDGRSGVDLGIKFDALLDGAVVDDWANTNSRHANEINTIIREDRGYDLRMRVLTQFGNSRPLSNLLRRLTACGCNCVVVEKNYDDREVEDLFDGHSHRRYRAHELPIRLHFFKIAGPMPADDMEEPLIYLGFTTLRRLHLTNHQGIRLGHIGRTVVSFPEANQYRQPCGVSRAGDNYVVISAPYQAVANATLQNVDGFEYRQQSYVGGTCAHASVHCVTGFLRRLIGTKALNGNDILDAVQSFHSSGKLVDDLIEDHIAKALAAAGCNVRAYYLTWGGSATFSPKKKLVFRDMMDVLHTAIDSQMPAILVLGTRPVDDPHAVVDRHAVVAVGHTAMRLGPPLHQHHQPRGEELVRTTTDWVKDILVHDDNIGPFLRIPVAAEHTYPRVEVPEHEDNDAARYDAVWERSLRKHLYSIIVPFPVGVNLCPTYVPAFLRRILNVKNLATMSGHLRKGKRYFSEIQEAASREELVISTYLDLSNRFRVKAIEQLDLHASGSLEAILLTHLSLPKYVYIASVTTLERVKNKGTFDAEILGYIVVDSSATRFSDDAVLLTRLGELIVYSGPGGMQNKEIEYHPRKQVIVPE